MFIALQKNLNFVITQGNGELLYINYLNFVHKITFHKWPSFSCTNIRYYANFVRLSFNCICYVLILWVLHINCLSLYYRHNKVSKFQLRIVLSRQNKKKKTEWNILVINKETNSCCQLQSKRLKLHTLFTVPWTCHVFHSSFNGHFTLPITVQWWTLVYAIPASHSTVWL